MAAIARGIARLLVSPARHAVWREERRSRRTVRTLSCGRRWRDRTVERRAAGGRGNDSTSLDATSWPHYTAPDNRSARGLLPPIAATLNKELKSDAPGGPFRPGF